ncbi:MAG: 4Fe-4S binding protein [Coprobacillus sp.]
MKRIFNEERCVGCGICTYHCPFELLSINKNKCNICDENKCTHCRRCEQVCPYTAISFEEHNTSTFPRLLEGVVIPFHNGCYQGLIEKLLAQITDELNLEDKLVIFKPTIARFEINVEIHATPDFLNAAKEYKLKHPDKVVIVYYCDEEPEQNAQAVHDFANLNNTQITVFHMLNYFSNLKKNTTTQECSVDICKLLVEINNANFVARGSYVNITSIKQVEGFIKTAILNQLAGKQFSFIDIILPCHWRIEGKPKTLITNHQVHDNIEWFKEIIINKYPLGIHK